MVTIDSREPVPQVLDDVYLYVLIRTDIDSLDRGKACAQSTHAANKCVYDIRHSADQWLHELLRSWEGNRGFGTAVILDGGSVGMMTRIYWKLQAAGHHTAIVHDPSYPLLDGKCVHKIPVDTCVYVFGEKSRLEPFLGNLEKY